MQFYESVNRLENRNRANTLNDIALAVATAQPGADSRPLKHRFEELIK